MVVYLREWYLSVFIGLANTYLWSINREGEKGQSARVQSRNTNSLTVEQRREGRHTGVLRQDPHPDKEPHSFRPIDFVP